MRKIFIDLSSDNYLQQPKMFGGYEGEHNETYLQVKLPKRMIDIECSGYRFDFQTSDGNKISSPLIQLSEDDTLSFHLTEQLTVAGKLIFKAVAVLANQNTVDLISKTNTVILYIEDSPKGNVQLIDPNGYKDELLEMIDNRILETNPSEVDQTYNPESTNAQSGKAVAEAIKQTNNIISNAIKGTKSGSVISVNDVSQIEHDIKVTLSNEPTVNRFDIFGVTGDSVDANHVDNTIKVNTYDTVNLGKLTDICTGVKGGDTIKMSFESDNVNSVLSLALLTSNNSYTSLCSVYSLSGGMALGEDTYVICTLPEDISNIYVQHEGLEATLSDIFIGLESVLEDFSSVEVTRYGKNLLPYPYIESSKTQNGVTYTDVGDGSIMISGSATNYTDFFINTIEINKNTQYCYNGFADSENIIAQVILKDVNQNTITSISANPLYQSQKVIVFNTDIYPTAVTATLLIKRGGNATVSGVIKPQLEVGLTATEYEPYKKMQTVKANADGTVIGLKSISPNMTLMTNAEGVLMDCTYNVDTKMYIDNELAKIKAELSAAILNT